MVSLTVCSQTYLVIGYDPENIIFSKEECLNIITYKDSLFRYLVSIKKKKHKMDLDKCTVGSASRLL